MRSTAIHKLRVNIKSLSYEARAIRAEAERCCALDRAELTEHRRGKLREEARIAHLALAFVRGKAFRSVEKTSLYDPSEKRLLEKINRTGYRATSQDVALWLEAS